MTFWGVGRGSAIGRGTALSSEVLIAGHGVRPAGALVGRLRSSGTSPCT